MTPLDDLLARVDAWCSLYLHSAAIDDVRQLAAHVRAMRDALENCLDETHGLWALGFEAGGRPDFCDGQRACRDEIEAAARAALDSGGE